MPCGGCPPADDEILNPCNTTPGTDCVHLHTDLDCLLPTLGLPCGTNLTTILKAIDAALGNSNVFPVITYNLGDLRNYYTITTVQQFFEASSIELIRQRTINQFLQEQINQIKSLLGNDTINHTHLTLLTNVIGYNDGDSVEEVLQKIINYLSTFTGGTGGTSPNFSATSSSTIQFITSGTQNHTLTGFVRIDPSSSNKLSVTNAGLLVIVPPQQLAFNSTTNVLSISGGNSVTLNGSQSSTSPNLIATDSPTIKFTTSGEQGHSITAVVDIDTLLSQIADNPTYRQRLCGICTTNDPCSGQSTAPLWTDTAETRCNGFNFEKRQKDTNTCSATVNQYRWITVNENSPTCGYTAANYCLSYNQVSSNCSAAGVGNQDCRSIVVQLKDSITGLAITSNENVSINYHWTSGSTNLITQHVFTIPAGATQAESICHCCTAGCGGGIFTDVYAVGAATNNNGGGYTICESSSNPCVRPAGLSDFVLSRSTAAAPDTFFSSIYEACSIGTVPTTPLNGTLAQITSLTVGATAYFLNGTDCTKLAPGYYIWKSLVDVNDIKSLYIDNNGVITTIYNCTGTANPIPVTPSVQVVSSCDTNSVGITGQVGTGNSVDLELIERGQIIQSFRIGNGPTINFSFIIFHNGTYKIRATDVVDPTKTLTTNDVTVSCSALPPDPYVPPVSPVTPVSPVSPVSPVYPVSPVSPVSPTPSTPSVTMLHNCTNHTTTISGMLGTGTNIGINLYKDSVFVRSSPDLTGGPSFNYTFTDINANGNYVARVYELNNDGNVLVSSVDIVLCEGTTTLPPECARPTGLTNYQATYIAQPTGGAAYTFSSHSDACHAYKDISTGYVPGTLNSYQIQLANTNVGTTAYFGQGTTDCQKLPTGYYYLLNSNGTSAGISIHIDSDGNIADTSNCFYNPPTTTPCTRPTGLVTFQLLWNAYPLSDISNVQAFTSLDDVCQKKLGIYTYATYASASNFSIQTTTIETGATLYLGNETNCSKVSAGFYYVLTGSGANAIQLAVQVDSNGVIVAISDCTSTTPAPTPPGTINPNDVGSAALNIVTLNGTANGVTQGPATVSVIVTTDGLSISNSELTAVADTNKCYLGGDKVSTALAIATYGYVMAGANQIGNYSFAFNLKKLRVAYPSTGLINFDVYVDPDQTSSYAVNRVNTTYHASGGLINTCPTDGSPCQPLYYNYDNPTAAISQFWHYNPGQAGSQNGSTSLAAQFTVSGGVKKKIGTMSVNLTTGVSQFVPINYP